MANPDHVKILKEGVEAWNKWRRDNPAVRPDLNTADLGAADLGTAYLHGANLYPAHQRGPSRGEFAIGLPARSVPRRGGPESCEPLWG